MRQSPTTRLRALVKRGKFLELPAAIERATVEQAYGKKKRGSRR